MLGAIQAAAEIHLSDELPIRQAVLVEKINLFRSYALMLGLPLIEHEHTTPIFFIGVGRPDVGYEIGQRLQEAGYFLSKRARFWQDKPSNHLPSDVNN